MAAFCGNRTPGFTEKSQFFLKRKKTSEPVFLHFLGFQDTVSFRGVVNLRSLEPNGIDPMIMHGL